MTPRATARARELLGADSTLVVDHCVVLDTDPTRARQAARELLGFLSQVTGYRAHFRRMGFTEDDVARLSDRMVDALVAWGDLDTVAARVTEQLTAGADQVALTVLPADGSATLPVEQWRWLADALVPGRSGQEQR